MYRPIALHLVRLRFSFTITWARAAHTMHTRNLVLMPSCCCVSFYQIVCLSVSFLTIRHSRFVVLAKGPAPARSTLGWTSSSRPRQTIPYKGHTRQTIQYKGHTLHYRVSTIVSLCACAAVTVKSRPGLRPHAGGAAAGAESAGASGSAGAGGCTRIQPPLGVVLL